MTKKGITFFLVPPDNERPRFIRIRFGIIIFLIVFLLGGVAAFFIPFNTLTLDIVEVNQKKNLTDQNRKLLEKIRDMREMFFQLKGKVDTLIQTRERVAEQVDIDEQKTVQKRSLHKHIKKMPLDEIIAYLNETEIFIADFAEKVEKNPYYSNYVPLIQPVIDDHVITARFGKRKDPFTGDIKWHNGIDFSAERETPVIATAAGTVDKVERHNYWGRRIRIRHRFGFSTVYAHLGTVKVKKGDNVRRGEVIATIGLSGMTSGPHLHYEIHHYDSIVNPELYFFPDTLMVASLR